MNETKLISVRLSADDIKTIDHYCEVNGYSKRSRLIYSAVHLMAALVKRNEISKITRFCPEFGDVIDEFTLEYHRDVF
jgi:metal-responsive CopG/Arc/MetJ family transcriptional regulator